jgi:hypothetical protein
VSFNVTFSNWKNVQGRGEKRYHTCSRLLLGEVFTPSWQARFSSTIDYIFLSIHIEHDTRR